MLRNTIRSRVYESLTGFTQGTTAPSSKLQQVKLSLTIFYKDFTSQPPKCPITKFYLANLFESVVLQLQYFGIK